MHNQRDEVTITPTFSLEQFIKDHQKSEQQGVHELTRPKFVKGDLEVLTEKYDPPRLIHRTTELQKIASMLLSFAGRSHPHNLFIYGRSGSGKTAAVRHTTMEIGRHAQLSRPLITLFANCRDQISHHGLIGKLIEELEKGKTIPTNTSWRELCSRFLAACRNAGANIVIILDEADGITKTKGDFDSLYYLSNLNSEMVGSQSTVSLVAITNDLHYGEHLEERVQSRLKVEKLHFAPYSAQQLQDILHDRTNVVFTSDGLEEGLIPYCAARAAQTHGDARYALALIYKASVIATETRSDQVSMQHVLQARSALEHDIISEGIDKLTVHEKLLLLAIARLSQSRVGNAMITMGSLHQAYGKVCTEAGMEPMSPTSVARLMGDIIDEGLIKTDVKSLGRARGRTTIVTLMVPVESTIQILLKEPLFNNP